MTRRHTKHLKKARLSPLVRREVGVSVAGFALVAAALSACSGDKLSAVATESGLAAANSTGATPGAGAAKVMVDGQDQNAAGPVRCRTSGGVVSIAIGQAPNGVVATVTDTTPPQAKSVTIANGGGMPLVSGQGKNKVTKTGNSYTITGTAAAWDPADPAHMKSKTFEIDVRCP